MPRPVPAGAAAGSGAPRAEAIDASAAHRRVETPFGCLKSRGLNFEDTHLTDTKRLAKLMDLLALAFAWTCKTGQLRNEQNPILFKKTLRRPLKSLFRHGLDFLRNIALNLNEKSQGFPWALEVLSCTSCRISLLIAPIPSRKVEHRVFYRYF